MGRPSSISTRRWRHRCSALQPRIQRQLTLRQESSEDGSRFTSRRRRRCRSIDIIEAGGAVRARARGPGAGIRLAAVVSHMTVRDRLESPRGPLRVGIGGPVGSGKTALVEALCKRLRDTYDLVRDHQRQRSVVLLRDMVGASSADACRLRAISDSAQRIRLHRGRSTLRRALGVSVRAQTWR